MAFIVLLLLSFTTLASIEVNRSELDRVKLLAQENARLGILSAIGELQRHTGPDQRTTARADINANLVNATNANAHWLGAYKNGTSGDYTKTPGEVATEIINASSSNGSQAKLLNWLVSGNEGLVSSDGTSNGLKFSPESTVNNLTSANALSTDITIANSPARLLVGPKTVGQSAVDYVAAPLVEVVNDDNVVTGGYAWWISDNGTKAPLNLTMPEALEESSYAFVTSPRAAIELMDAENASDQVTLASSDMLELDPMSDEAVYDPTDPDLPRLLDLDQMPLLKGSANRSTLSKLIDLRYHDLTTESQGLLTDTYAGGLKQDMSVLLSTSALEPLDTDFLFQTEPDPNDSAEPDFGVPTWGQLRSFAQTTVNDELTPRLPTETESGIAPLLTYFSLGFEYIVSAAGIDIHLAVSPVVVLWNPYTVPIKAAKYEVGMQRRSSDKAWFQLQESQPDGSWKDKETRSLNRAGGTWNGGEKHRYFRFVVDADAIPPGKSIIYTLEGSESGKTYDAPSDGEPENVLTPGFNPTGHVLMRSISKKSEDSDASTVYRVAVDRTDTSNRTITGNTSYISYNNFKPNQGELCTYLGEVVSTEPIGTNPTADKRWYQSFTRAYPGTFPGMSSSGHTGLAQGPAPLSSLTTPAFAQTFKARFSGSPMRWLAQGNPRAFIAMRYPRRLGDSGDGMDTTTPGYIGTSSNTDWPQFIVGDDEDASSGYGLDADGSGETIQATLFEYRPENQPLLSLGQLQHANLGITNGHPAYAIGNSLADFRLGSLSDVLYFANDNTYKPTALVRIYYDFSWNLNRALWDRYFVSTVPNVGTGKITDTVLTPIPDQLPNSRIKLNDVYVESEIRDANLAAKHMSINGAFNINSTSEQAWRAVLGGANQLGYDPVSGTLSTDRTQAALSRFTKPTTAPNAVSATWQGHRELDEEQIAQLAANIVEEIRNRGPFVSLADFVNRRLVDNPNTQYPDGDPLDERLRGTLQGAIDRTTSGALAANNDTTLHLDDIPDYSDTSQYYNKSAMRGGRDSVAPYSSKSAFAPQFLTQADILSAIGPILSARSDTFTIRSYGEYVNPLTNNIESRAWCEAVVQRTYNYVDDGVSPETPPSLAGAINQSLGRKYEIISFKWLTPEEI